MPRAGGVRTAAACCSRRRARPCRCRACPRSSGSGRWPSAPTARSPRCRKCCRCREPSPGAYSPDGRRVAYEEIGLGFASDWAQNQSSLWRNYRGGRTRPIRLINLADHAVEKLPWANSNDSAPMWVGDTVYFLSDRNGTTNLFSYRPGAKDVTALTRHDDFDVMNASATSDAIVYEQGGDLHLLDLASKQARKLTIEVTGDFPWARTQLKKVAAMVRSAVLSPTGVRAAFEARGEIFTVPAEKGQPRNLTQSSGTHDRSPVWSPDGRDIAWLSDASGEYQLMIAEQTGVTKPRDDRAAVKGVLLRAGVVARWQAAAARGQPPGLVGDRRRQRRHSDAEARHRHLRRPGPPLRRGLVARLAVDRVLEEPRQSPARDLPLLDRRQARAPGHRRPLGCHRAGLRCVGQVSVLPRQHQLRAAYQLARDELGRPARHARRLSRRAQRQRAVAAPARDRRRAGAGCRRWRQTGATAAGARRHQGHRSADSRAWRARRRLFVA